MHLTKTTYKYAWLGLILLFLLCLFINVSIGSVSIPLETIWKVFTGGTHVDNTIQYIIVNYRLPKTFASIIAGSGLGISGLLMQTYFRNPLAGPFVLGISSGASLGVALLLMGSSFLGLSSILYHYSIPLAASLGSFLVLAIVMFASKNIRNTLSILIIGLMFGSFASAIISVLSYFSSANNLQQYIFWSLGSLADLQWNEIYLLLFILGISFVALLFIIKPLNALLLGENYAKSLGINLKNTQALVFIITSLLTGSITAFVGPIAFIGLAIPHITKLVFSTSNHKILIPAVGIIGAIVLLICDSLSHIPLASKSLPINAITSLLGAPIVIWLLISKSKRVY